MPAISLIPIPYYQPLDPYNHEVDNRPIIALAQQIEMVNLAVDNQGANLASAAGNQGTVGNRINQSIDNDGSLKTSAIDDALHSIEAHTDTPSYVRMTVAERAKLSYISDDATALKVQVNAVGGPVLFDDTTMELDESSTIQWSLIGNKVYANANFPASVRHTHYYGLTPVDQNLITPNYIDYFVTSVATSYMQGSLRVFINGVRLTPGVATYVPIGQPGTVTYLSMTYSEDAPTGGSVPTGGFSLSVPKPLSAVITVDFDVQYV